FKSCLLKLKLNASIMLVSLFFAYSLYLACTELDIGIEINNNFMPNADDQITISACVDIHKLLLSRSDLQFWNLNFSNFSLQQLLNEIVRHNPIQASCII